MLRKYDQHNKKNYQMKKIIEKYCNNSEIKNGLMLVDMPTDTGKTYAIIEHIKDNYESFC